MERVRAELSALRRAGAHALHDTAARGLAGNEPGPDQLGQVYEYVPSATELRVAAGVFGVGFLLFTLMVKVSVALLFGRPQPEHAEAHA